MRERVGEKGAQVEIGLVHEHTVGRVRRVGEADEARTHDLRGRRDRLDGVVGEAVHRQLLVDRAAAQAVRLVLDLPVVDAVAGRED